CTFCFCPFYPCMDERTGGKYVERSTGGTVWSCAGCELIHRTEVAQRVLDALLEGQSVRQAWDTVMRRLL
ncbi:MAG TPA: threonine-phosphate decarboxylase, partial [Candidatus Methanoperedenaceae archaeon]|nr:threonine-phosphate decarboxylase [Candidatus Methanoperedenaceae archaeon]